PSRPSGSAVAPGCARQVIATMALDSLRRCRTTAPLSSRCMLAFGFSGIRMSGLVVPFAHPNGSIGMIAESRITRRAREMNIRSQPGTDKVTRSGLGNIEARVLRRHEFQDADDFGFLNPLDSGRVTGQQLPIFQQDMALPHDSRPARVCLRLVQVLGDELPPRTAHLRIAEAILRRATQFRKDLLAHCLQPILLTGAIHSNESRIWQREEERD